MAACSAIIDEERDNFFRLSLLLFRVGNQKLREFFKSRWPIVYQNKTGVPPPVVPWNDTPNDATEMNKIEIKLKFQFKDQKKSFDSGNTNNWDFSILTTVLINSSLDFVTAASPESNAIKHMKGIRNNFIGHAPDARIPTAVFNTEWPKACQALKYFNATQEEFDDVLKDVEKPIECILPILKELNLRLDRHESNILNVVYQLQEEMEKQNKEILTAIRSLCVPAAISPVSVTAVLAIQPEREHNELVASCPENYMGNETKSNVGHENCYYNDYCGSSDDDDKSCAFCLCCWFVEFKSRNREKGIKYTSSRIRNKYNSLRSSNFAGVERTSWFSDPVYTLSSPIIIDEGPSPSLVLIGKTLETEEDIYDDMNTGEEPVDPKSIDEGPSPSSVLIGKTLETEEDFYDDMNTGEEPVATYEPVVTYEPVATYEPVVTYEPVPSPISIYEVTLYELCRNDPTVFQDLGRELDHDEATVARNPSELETTASPTRILLEWLMMIRRDFMVSKLLKVFSQLGLNEAYGVLQEKLSRYYNKLGQHK